MTKRLNVFILVILLSVVCLFSQSFAEDQCTTTEVEDVLYTYQEALEIKDDSTMDTILASDFIRVFINNVYSPPVTNTIDRQDYLDWLHDGEQSGNIFDEIIVSDINIEFPEETDMALVAATVYAEWGSLPNETLHRNAFSLIKENGSCVIRTFYSEQYYNKSCSLYGC